MSQYRSIRIRTRFQTGQSASYHKQRQNEEVETVDPASRYEHQSTDTEENQSCYHSPPVTPLPDNPSGRQRHQKVGTIDSSLRQGRHRLADMERLLKMRIQHLEDAMVIISLFYCFHLFSSLFSYTALQFYLQIHKNTAKGDTLSTRRDNNHLLEEGFSLCIQLKIR